MERIREEDGKKTGRRQEEVGKKTGRGREEDKKECVTIQPQLDLQSAGSSPNLTYTKWSALDAKRIL